MRFDLGSMQHFLTDLDFSSLERFFNGNRFGSLQGIGSSADNN